MQESINTADLIFKKLFRICVPYLASLSDEEVDMFGTHHLNDAEYDTYQRNQDTYRYATINDMIELMRRGCPIKITNYKDSETIYECIIKHLEMWKNRDTGDFISLNLNRRPPPLEDLEDLDRLASMIFPYAKDFAKTTRVENPFTGSMDEFTLFPNSELFGVSPINRLPQDMYQSIKDEVDEPTDYKSMADLFAERHASTTAGVYHIATKTEE